MRRIARNTGWLYIQHGVTLAVDLIVTRLLLDALGVIDLGVFAAVSGVIGILVFFKGALGETFCKYLSAESGRTGAVWDLFPAVLLMAVLCAVAVALVGETLGFVFVRFVLSIPSERMATATSAYHLVVGASVVTVIRTAFESCLKAAERMEAFAVGGVLEAGLSLVVVGILALCPSAHRLEAYAALNLLVAALLCLYFAGRARRLLSVSLVPQLMKERLVEMLRFWLGGSLVSVANDLKYKGTELLINGFAGVGFNAAWTLACKFCTIPHAIAGDFHVAVMPPIMKLKAVGRMKSLMALLESSERISFSLFWVVGFPAFLYAPELVRFWLGANMPPQTAEFLRALLVFFLFDALTGPLHYAIISAHRVTRYQVGASIVMGSGFVFALIALSAGLPPWTAPAGVAFSNALSFVYRLICIRRYVDASVGRFLRNAVLPIAVVVAISVLAALLFGNLVGVAVALLSAAGLKILHYRIADEEPRLADCCHSRTVLRNAGHLKNGISRAL